MAFGGDGLTSAALRESVASFWDLRGAYRPLGISFHDTGHD